MSIKRGNNFVLYMFKQDLDNMKKWVLQYPNKETGGDLFGLWSGEGHNAVIHVVLGPGRNCTHGGYNFYQDVDYLREVGSLLTQHYMLGHIGEWHSHHHLQLDSPSEGDCRTIERNFPQGACGFFLMIANIVHRDEVLFSPYIFKANSGRYRAGYVKEINAKGPFSLVKDISQILEEGKEGEKMVVSRNEPEKEGHKEKSFLSSLKDVAIMVIHDIFGEEPVESARGAQKTSTVYQVKIPLNSFQWYSKKENHAVIKGIFSGLRKRVGKIEIIFDDDYLQNMNMVFVYNTHEISIRFPARFPLIPARILKTKKFLDLVCLPRCVNFQSFDLKEFLEIVLKILSNLNDWS